MGTISVKELGRQDATSNSCHVVTSYHLCLHHNISCPDLPPIEANGCAEKGLYIPVRCLALPAPQVVSLIKLIKCSCKACSKGQCICSKHGLPCTPLCKCYCRDCTNTTIIREDIRDSESDDDESMIVILQCR